MKISQIVIELLTRCNFLCPYCRDTSGEKKSIPLEDVKKLVDSFQEFGVTKVQLDGGETFLYEEMFELLEYIVSKNLEVGIYTNASVITPETARYLTKYPSIKLCVTIHPLNPEKQVAATIKGIQNLKDAGLYPQIVYVVSSKSYIKLAETLEKLPNEKYTIVLNPIVQSGRAFDNAILPINDKQRQEFVEIVEQVKMKYSNLKIADNVSIKSEDLKIESIQMNDDEEFALHINTDGYVLPFFSADNSTAIGNVNDLEDLKRQLMDPKTMDYLAKSRLAMKRRIEGKQNSVNRKIGRAEIV